MTRYEKEQMEEWREEMRQDAYDEHKHERAMWEDDEFFEQHVDDESGVCEALAIVKKHCKNYGRDFDQVVENYKGQL